MAFIDIQDPKTRDAIVADYLATIRRVRMKNENDRAIGLVKEVELEKTFAPIIEKTTDAIAEKLKPLAPPPPPPPLARKRKRTKGFNAFDYFMQTNDKKKLDQYYGIQLDGDQLMMGDKEVTVDEDSNIIVDNKTYKGTTGLWSLIMLTAPKGNSYTNDDLANYRDLAQRTDVMHHPRGLSDTSRPTTTAKRHMLEDLVPKEEEEKEGEGILFLPGDIKGLKTKLNLLLAEYRAGNKSSTRNEIVSIVDELRRRKRISLKDYRDINKFIAP